MRAMVMRRVVSLPETDSPLELVDMPRPEVQEGEVLVRVATCGVCHTELDEIEGRTLPPRLPIVLGHEVVGVIEEVGAGVDVGRHGQRVGVGWIHSSTGESDENLSPRFTATGRDVNGGYAEYMTVPAAYAFPIPSIYTDAEASPLLCAGAIGYRAVRLTQVRDGDSLGLTGFGASAHLVLQLVRHRYPNTRVYVFARDAGQRQLAEELGAIWTGSMTDRAPVGLDAIIDTTPVWKPVVEALTNLRPGGRLVINAIRKEDTDKSELLRLNYHDHLWMEREIKTVANITGRDIAEFLPLAAAIPIRPHVTTYRLEAANKALWELKRGSAQGARVLLVE